MIATRAINTSILFLSLLALATRVEGQRSVSEEAVTYFKTNCTSCHTVGGGNIVGPDLMHVGKRKDRAWLIKFMRDPKGVIDSGDPYALELLKDSKGQVMPSLPGFTADMAAKILDVLEVESEMPKGKSRFAGVSIPERPFVAADVSNGRELFLGRKSFAAGAPSCVSCHTASDLGGLGGGTLGPDLTSAFARLNGRKALGAWLSAPPSLVMQPVFKNHAMEGEEILQVVAYLKSLAERGEGESESKTLAFLLWGVGGAAAVLVLFDFLWRRRYRAVRRPLVNKDSRS